jgi:hypothetical protein
MRIERAMYLGYYLKELDRQKFVLFLDHVCSLTGRSKRAILTDVLRSVFTYNISILEYFQFQFYDLSKQERTAWAGTGHMYEYQLKMNPLDQRDILNNKTLFYKNYELFFIHRVADTKDIKNEPAVADAILSNPSGKLVFKAAEGKCGAQVAIRSCAEFDRQRLIEFMKDSEYGLVEEFVEQHPDMNRLSPSAVNTVRIITQLNKKDEVDILGCRLRISVNLSVDNMAAGNLAAFVEEKSGIVVGPAVYSDITKSDAEYHPVTNMRIPGFQIPFWKETLVLAEEAALLHPQNRSIGWDIVITKKGPGLIEGNHDWCKLLWQLPAKKGMKDILNGYKENV